MVPDRQGCGFWNLHHTEPCYQTAHGLHPGSLPPQPTPTHLAAVPTVLHVNPVVLVVPEALDAQKVGILSFVTARCQWVDEEALRHLPLPGQHQDPAVHP